MWEQPIDGGHSVALGALVDRDTGESFAAFDLDATGTWVLGLRCSTCQNPAPVVFAVLEPEESK
jgi:hypothetical protein